jgi:hypothetical protein
MAGKGTGKGGGGAMLLLVLLLCAGVGGAWNYQRNLALEEQKKGERPFNGYSDQDLAALAEAYRQEIDAFDRRYRASLQGRTQARDRGLLGERVNEFERVQRSNDRIREATAEVAQREARLADISAEQRYRAQAGSQSLILHLGRLTKI